MARWFFISPMFLVVGIVVGLWVILFQSPLVRHVTWYFSIHGRRSEEPPPKWTRGDFEGYLTTMHHPFADMVDYVMGCTICQSIHAGWAAAILYIAITPLSVLWFPPLWLFFVAVFFYLFKKLTHV